MLEDKAGNLWFGTRNHGIYRYNGKSLDNFLNGNEPKFNLGNYHQFILDILQDRNGTYGLVPGIAVACGNTTEKNLKIIFLLRITI